MADSYQRTAQLAAEPAVVFAALTSGVAGWWSTASEDASEQGAVATFRFDETFNVMRVEKLTKEREVRWSCIEQRHVNPALKSDDEWVGTTLIWRLVPVSTDATSLTFIHEGLVASMECWEICRAGWDHFLLESLKAYVETGIGQPYQHGATS